MKHNLDNKTSQIILDAFLHSRIHTEADLSSFKRKMAKKLKIPCLSNSALLRIYHEMAKNKSSKELTRMSQLLRKRPIRSLSGIVNVSVLTKFYPCPGHCIFCPEQKGLPKSYLKDEPAVQRAIATHFNPFEQISVRLRALKNIGHPIDKIELRIIGGTWSYYPKKYRIWFVKECFRACNEFPKKNHKKPQPPFTKTNIQKLYQQLAREQKKNEKTKCRLVGITIETRPDYINTREIKLMRELGVTRVELGVQSIYDDVLRLVNRGHNVASTIEATHLLKDAGFKVSYQMMPNLPGSGFKRDIEMFKIIFRNQNFQPDLLKIYPLALIKSTPLYQWYLRKKFKPYSKKELIELLIKIKENIPPYCRIQRIIRDIPSKNIVAGGAKISNLREIVQSEMKKRGLQCHCIRCREIRARDNVESLTPQKIKTLSLFREDYQASEGREIFLSFENKERTKLYALLRLRIPSASQRVLWNLFPVLKHASLVREIHTYGQMLSIGEKSHSPQHQGLGKKLMRLAEKITKQEFKLNKIAVISGVGVRDYYRKLGYKLKETYMVKTI